MPTVWIDRSTHIGFAWDLRRHAAKGWFKVLILGKTGKTHGKEDPLKHLAVVLRLFRHIEPKFVFGIVVLGEIKQDGG